MLIALDYLDSYTADPAFWNEFIALATRHGHRVVGTSIRSEGAPPVPMPVPVIYAGNTPYVDALQQAGMPAADVWVGAHPALVGLVIADCACGRVGDQSLWTARFRSSVQLEPGADQQS